MNKNVSRYIYCLIFICFGCSCQNEESSVDLKQEVIPVMETEEEFDPLAYEHVKERIIFRWLGGYSDVEKDKMRDWLVTATMHTQRVLGVYPFKMRYFLHRIDDLDQPVLFAHTKHKLKHDIHFYLDPNYPLESFMEDWKAPHEISHLAIPHVGRENSWFAEGFATFMSRQVMMDMDLVSAAEVDSVYRVKIADAGLAFQSDKPFTEIADSLIGEREFPKMYWGSVAYFYLADQKLKREYELTLCDIVIMYQEELTLNDDTLEDVVASFDMLSETTIFSDLLRNFRALPAREIFEEIQALN